MIFSRRSFIALALGLLTALTATVEAASAKKKATVADAAAYKGAIVLDAASGKVLFEDHADTISPPASMTKLMTFAVVYDALQAGTVQLATPVRITNEDSKIGGTQVFLDPRETFPVEELLYAMMIQSANDAAHALARTTAGSVPAFVELMNAKAKSLGMTNTTFRSPHGLPPSNRKVAEGDLTTPRDFALLCQHLLTKTDVLKYASVRSRPFGTGVRPEPMAMVNHNHLLGKVAGVDGLKTGFTNGAGFCLSATALRNGRRVIVVTMGSEQAKVRDLKVAELLERGFAALPPAPPTPVAAAPAVRSANASPAPASTASASSPNSVPVATDTPIRPAPKPVATPTSPAPATSSTEPMIKFNVPKK